MQKAGNIFTSLKIVALLFFLSGIFSVIDMIIRLMSGSVYLNFNVLGIPTYFGLRRFSRGWRTFALVCTWFALILLAVFFVLGLASSRPAYFSPFGIYVEISAMWFSIVMVSNFLLELWQYRVLTNPEIRDRFLSTS